MVDQIKIGGLYEHYKGMKYRIHNVVRHSETLEWMVFYECLYENPTAKFWVRPLAMFCENVQRDGETVPRFKLLDG
jgi:hypothetical protein